MTPEQAMAVVKQFDSPHPHWQIYSHISFPRLIRLKFVFRGPNSNKPGEPCHVEHHRSYPLPGLNAEEFAHLIAEFWRKSWIHESMEWLNRNGSLFKDPHQGERRWVSTKKNTMKL